MANMTSDMAFECVFIARDPDLFCTMNRLLRNLSIRTEICLRPSEASRLLMKGSTDLLVVDCEINESLEFLREVGKSGKWRKPTIVAIAPLDYSVPAAHVVLKKPITAETGTKSLKIAYSRMLRNFRRRARCALMMPTMATGQDGRMFPTVATDISNGGIGLKAKARLSTGDVLLFRLLLPGTRQPILIRSRVVWTREYGRAGCEFLRIDPPGGKMLHDWLKQRLQVKKAVNLLGGAIHFAPDQGNEIKLT